MPLYITVSAGPSADQATPLIGICDRRIIDSMLRAIRRIATVEDGPTRKVQHDLGQAETRSGLHVVNSEVSNARP